MPGSIGAIGQGERVIREIRIESREENSTRPVEILSVATADDGCVRAQVKQAPSGPWIEAVFTGPSQDGPRSGVMVIAAKADKVYRINVGYLMLVLPGAK